MSTALRVRRLVALYGRVAVVFLLVVGALALFGAWSAYTNPPTQETTVEVNQQQVRTSIETSAVVTGNTSLYRRGEVLTDKSAYFVSATPNLTLTVRTTVPEGQPVVVGHRLVLDLSAARGGEPFWNRTRLLLADSGTTRNGTFASTARLNMSNVSDIVTERREEIGDVGTLRVVLRLNATYETDRYEGTVTASSPVALTGGAYWLSEDVAASERRSQTVTRTVEGSPDPTTYLGLGTLGVLSLLGAVAVGYTLTDDLDVEDIETELAERRHDEWISDGEFPTNTQKRYVRISSLADLVDIAIDSNKRVVHDGEYGAYAVVDGDVVYYFAVGDLDVENWVEM